MNYTNIVEMVSVAEQLAKRSYHSVLKREAKLIQTASYIAEQIDLDVKLVMNLLNELEKEKYVAVVDTDNTSRGVGNRKEYTITELGEKVLLS